MSAPAGLDADGRGGLTLGGARYLLIRPETLVAMQKAVQQAVGERAGACIVAGGRAGGARAAASLDGTAEERVRRLLRIRDDPAIVMKPILPVSWFKNVRMCVFRSCSG